MAKEKKQKTVEDKRKRSEAIFKIALPVVNATSASIAKVLVEHFLKGV